MELSNYWFLRVYVCGV